MTQPQTVTLCDGRAGVRSLLNVSTREAEQKNSALDFIASSEAVDRYSEIILAGGWRLEAYRRNPVFQNAHQYGDIIFTLGKALTTEVRDGRLCQRVEFAVEVNPMARIAYGLYRGRFLNAVSVGFIPLRWENGAPGDAWRRRYLEQELLEVSAVGIPANPEALQLGLGAGAIRKSDLQELLRMLECLPSSQPISASSAPGAESRAGASAVRADPARLLRLARDLRHALRRA